MIAKKMTPGSSKWLQSLSYYKVRYLSFKFDEIVVRKLYVNV